MPRSVTHGINVHAKPWGYNDPYVWNGAPAIIDAVQALGFTAIRLDIGPSSAYTTIPNALQRTQVLMGLCRDRGIKVQLVFTLPFKSNRTNDGAFPDTPAGRYQQGLVLVRDTLLALPYTPHEIEIENEIPIACGIPWNAGQTVSEYNQTYANPGNFTFAEWAQVMKGEYDAIRAHAPTAKIILGTVSRNYAFIPWLRTQGMEPDIVGFHIYFRAGNEESLSNWQGGGSWHTQVMAYNKPLTINEINGNPGSGQPAMAQWATKAMDEVLASPAPVESVYVYELLDSAHEGGFGMGTLPEGGFVRKTVNNGFLAARKK
jgi:hypothetical protein